MFNMMILKKDLFDDYCEWEFKILFELYNRVDQSEMTDFDKRLFGRISEILFNVWLNKKIKDGKLSKIKVFLKAKFLHKRIEASS